MQPVLDYLKQNQSRFLAEFCEYLRFPSVSAQPQHKHDVRACAEWLVAHCRQIGLEARLCETPGHPVVVAKTPATGEPRRARSNEVRALARRGAVNPNSEVGPGNSSKVLIGSGSGRRRRGNFAPASCSRGAHGVTRPTNDGLATGLFDFIAHFGVRGKA